MNTSRKILSLFMVWLISFSQLTLWSIVGLSTSSSSNVDGKKVRPILNATPETRYIRLNSEWTDGGSFGVDLIWPSIETFTTEPVIADADRYTLITDNILSGLNVPYNTTSYATPGRSYQKQGNYAVRTIAGGAEDGNKIRIFTYQANNSSDTSVNDRVWQITIANRSGYYLTSHILEFYTVAKFGAPSTTRFDGTPISTVNDGEIAFRASPNVEDQQAPVFTNNSSSVDNDEFPIRQVNRQYKDNFAFTFELTDNTADAGNNHNWRIRDPETHNDRNAGSGFRPNETHTTADTTITNQDGVDTWNFTLEIFIATGWDSNSSQTTRSTREHSYHFTGTSSAITFTGHDKTRRYRDKNFSGTLNPTAIADFGVEELVVISGYVADRNMYPDTGTPSTRDREDLTGHSQRDSSNSTNFVYYFNQGMKPRFNNTISGSYTHTPTCNMAISRYQTGFAISDFSGFLHDDRAWVDTGSIKLTITGTIGWAVLWNTYTAADSNIILENFGFQGTGCRNESASNGNSSYQYSDGQHLSDNNLVCDDGTYTSTGNYKLNFSDLTRSFDPETSVYISLSYLDQKGKTSRPISCERINHSKAPRFTNTGDSTWIPGSFDSSFWASLMNLSNYPQGVQIDDVDIQLQDDRAGVDTGSIDIEIAGYSLDSAKTNIEIKTISINDTTNTDNYTQINGAGLRYNGLEVYYPNYQDENGDRVRSIANRQLLNYELNFSQDDANDSSFTGYFAPEVELDIDGTFKDLANITVSNPLNQTYRNNHTPQFREHDKTTSFTGSTDKLLDGGDDTSAEVDNYTTAVGGTDTEMIKLFSGDSADARIFPYDGSGTQAGATWVDSTEVAFNITDNRAGIDSGSIKVVFSGTRRATPVTYTVYTSGMYINGTWFDANRKINLTSFDRWDNRWAEHNLLNYLAQIKDDHNIYFDRQSRGWAAPVPGKESRYSISLYADDLKQPTWNSTTITYEKDMENLQCTLLDRCNTRLYFTYKYDGETVEPVVDTGVHPFVGQTVYVIWSWVVVDTGNYTIACNGAGSLGTPLDITFDNILRTGLDNPYQDYDSATLLVNDGYFELSGQKLILK